MSIKARIMDDLKTAMKSQNKERMSVLRMVLSDLKYAAAQENVHAEMSEETEIKVISTYHKRLLKSRDEFPEGEKRVAIDAELKIVEEYLPKKAGPEQIQAVINELIKTSTDRQFGALMKQVMAKLGSAADGKIVSELLKKSLG